MAFDGRVTRETPQGVAFLFAGVGDHYPGMGRGLYEAERAYRDAVDQCAALLAPHLGGDIRELLYPAGLPAAGEGGGIDLRAMLRRPRAANADLPRPSGTLDRTLFAQTGLFVTEWALAALWASRGVRPAVMIGHSLGEWTAATVAGVFPLEDALRLLVARSRSIETLGAGAMLAVPMAEHEVRALLRDGASVATVNSPALTVVSGPADVIGALDAELAYGGVVCHRLPVDRAFHSPMLRPAADELRSLLADVRLGAPHVPFVSNVTGTWIGVGDATDPEYWAAHLCGTVRFADGIATLAAAGPRALVEIGPGLTLGTFARQCEVGTPDDVVASMRHAWERADDVELFRDALARVHGAQRRAPPPASRALTDAEAVIAGIWCALLGVREVGAGDDFLRLGGDSLRSTRLVSRLRDAFGVELSVREVFAARTVASQARLVEDAIIAQLEAMSDDEVREAL